MNIKVLDHGYVEFVEAWGHGKDGCDDYVQREQGDVYAVRNDDFEVGIIEAARQSTQGSFRGWDQDAKLLKYLHDHKHATPFEFAGMVIEVQAPIFVFREWHRHRTQSYNEMSARYTPLPDLYYYPTEERLFLDGGANKQAQVVGERDEGWMRAWHKTLAEFYRHSEEFYQQGLRYGVPKELARLVMPVSHYSKMRASANLRNWLSFLTLRTDPAAQWEIRQYAEAVGQLIKQTFPQTYRLWEASK